MFIQIIKYNFHPYKSETCKSDIELLVNRLSSHESVIPFEYNSFDFCQDDSGERSPTENLGMVRLNNFYPIS